MEAHFVTRVKVKDKVHCMCQSCHKDPNFVQEILRHPTLYSNLDNADLTTETFPECVHTKVADLLAAKNKYPSISTPEVALLNDAPHICTEFKFREDTKFERVAFCKFLDNNRSE